jgi:uncharacterized membrane protein YgcG
VYVAELPRKLRFSVLQAETRGPIVHAVILCQVQLGLEVRARPAGGEPIDRTISWTVELAPVCTDHVGYASLPLDGIRLLEQQLLRARDHAIAAGATVDIFRVSIERVIARSPYALAFEHDFTPQLESFVGGALAEPITAPERVLVVPTIDLPDGAQAVLPAIVDPDVDDWRLSPASFGMTSLPMIGEEGCQTLLPSYEAERVVRFAQVLRTPILGMPRLPSIITGSKATLPYRPARLVEYETVWNPLNHALGRVLYSLTLAPCEAANVATVDWRRTDTMSRSEAVSTRDALLHDQRRDRNVEEVLDATVTEWQKGEAFQGGTAGVGGYGGQGSGSMWGVTGSHAIGWTTSSSEGERNVEASTVQRLGDTVAQASRMVRDLRSTVVVQATQSETESVQTRTVRNHNHSHALTVLYYEVVRHYIITTRAVRERDVVLVRYDRITFTRDIARRYATVLAANLLDTSLAGAFADLAASERSTDELRRHVEDGDLRTLHVRVEMGAVTGDTDQMTRDRMRLLVLTNDGAIRHLSFATASLAHFAGDQPFTESFESESVNTTTAVFDVATALAGVRLDDVRELGLSFDVRGDLNPHKVQISRISVRAIADISGVRRLVPVMSAHPVHYFHRDGEWWAEPNELPSFSASDERERRIQSLIDHLQANAAHYNRVLWLAEDAADRLARFELVGYPPDHPAGSLADFVDSAPIGVRGDYLAFTTSPFRRILDGEIPADERVVSLPTRGAFAEVQLSHCNASELIDDRRFWDWQQSPCGDEPPSIGGVTIGSRYRDALNATPTALGEPGVDIRDPAAAPDPSGLGTLLDTVMTSEVFRDMSGRAELAGILTELTKAAASVEQKRMDSLVSLAQTDAELERSRIDAQRAAATGRDCSDSSGGTSGSSGGTSGSSGGTSGSSGGTSDTPGPSSGGDVPPGPSTDDDDDDDTPPPPPPHDHEEPEPEEDEDEAEEIDRAELMVSFRDVNGGSLIGTHYVKVWYTDRETGVQHSVDRRVTGRSIVRLSIPTSIRPNVIVQSWSYGASLPDWRNLDALRRFLTGALPALPLRSFSFDPPVRGEDTITIDPMDPATLRVSLSLAESVQEIRVRGAGQLQHTIQDAVNLGGELGLGAIERLAADASVTGSISETVGWLFGGEAEVETTVRLTFMRNRFQPAVQGSGGSDD